MPELVVTDTLGLLNSYRALDFSGVEISTAVTKAEAANDVVGNFILNPPS